MSLTAYMRIVLAAVAHNEVAADGWWGPGVASVNQQLRALERRGLIERDDDNDHRLTDEGWHEFHRLFRAGSTS